MCIWNLLWTFKVGKISTFLIFHLPPTFGLVLKDLDLLSSNLQSVLKLGQRVKSYRPLKCRKSIAESTWPFCRKLQHPHFSPESTARGCFVIGRTRPMCSYQFCLKILNFEKVPISHFSHGKILSSFGENTWGVTPLRLSKFHLKQLVFLFLAIFFQPFSGGALGLVKIIK